MLNPNMPSSNDVVYEPLLEGEYSDDGLDEKVVFLQKPSRRWWSYAILSQLFLIAIYTGVSLAVIRAAVQDSVPDIHGEEQCYRGPPPHPPHRELSLIRIPLP